MGAPRQGPTNPGPAFRAALPKAGPAHPRKVMVGEVQQEERGQVRRMLSMKEWASAARHRGRADGHRGTILKAT